MSDSNWSPHTDDPVLIDLRRRYASFDSPLKSHASMWDAQFVAREIDLSRFRADNAYIWQVRNGYAGACPGLTYGTYASYLLGRDRRGLFELLHEDGAFGCITFNYHGQKLISRDLLDSINELCFLDREFGLFSHDRDLGILDIGAGYGRLAHRMSCADVRLRQYICVDAVPESTYLCQGYLRYRQVNDKCLVLALDDIPHRLLGHSVDLAISIHSFSEMAYGAIMAWLDLVVDLRVPSLLVVPNDHDGIYSGEADGSRYDCLPEIRKRGFSLVRDEPVVTGNVTASWDEHFLLFQRN